MAVRAAARLPGRGVLRHVLHRLRRRPVRRDREDLRRARPADVGHGRRRDAGVHRRPPEGRRTASTGTGPRSTASIPRRCAGTSRPTSSASGSSPRPATEIRHDDRRPHHHARLAHPRVRRTGRRAEARHRRRPRARHRARSWSARAGDPVQPQRPRAHQRRQHDGAPRPAVLAGHGDHGHRRRVRRGHRGAARRARRRDHAAGATAASPSTRSARRSRRSRCPTTSPCPTPPRCSSRSTSPGSASTTGPTSEAGQTVLIHAAAGGAGSAAIQLAVDRGAQVIATVGADEKIQLCRDLGAQTVVNYRTDEFAAGRASSRRAARASTWCSTTSATR